MIPQHANAVFIFISLRSTVSTMIFNGTLKMLYIALLWLSGTTIDFRVPIAGKYRPTQHSNTRKQRNIMV